MTANRLGQVFTPAPVAEFMTRWAAADRPRRILDPCLGRGVFVHCLDALHDRQLLAKNAAVTACEIDPVLLAEFRATRNGRDPLPVQIHQADFLTARFSEPFDTVICNPPYVRHHAHRRNERLFRRFDRLAGRRLSRRTNLYGLFLLRIWELLGPAGRAAVITPAEWLNADFGVALKACLLARNVFDAIIQFDPAARVFARALTTAAITLLRRGRRSDEPVLFRLARDERALLDGMPGRALRPDQLDPAEKWSPLFSSRPGRTGQDAPLSRFAACARGIATGANAYFVLRPSELRTAGIDRHDVVVCISKARQVRGERLTAGDVRRLIAADERVFLLNPRQPPRPAVRRYLDHGRRLGIDRRYLPAHRPCWFRPEHRDPAPLWVSVFARGGFRFIRNEAGALHLTAFHAIYPCDGIDPDHLHAALRRAAARGAPDAQQRIYGGGLRKLEPRDVERLMIPFRP